MGTNLKKTLKNFDSENKVSLGTIEALSDWMDTKFKIPGTNIRFGLDPILSLIPGVGDVLSIGVSISIFGLILAKGVPFFTAIKMMFNVILDFIFSSIPVLGTIADIGYKANIKNLNLLEKHLKNNPDGDYHYGVWLVFLLTIFIVIVMIFALFYLIAQVLNSLVGLG